MSTETIIKRGHHLVITKSDDWTEDDPYFDGSIVCLAPDLCNGWWECHETHEVDGKSASSGPYACDDDDAWLDQDEFEFHGQMHTWQYGAGWTVPYPRCVVQATSEGVCDATYEIGREHGEGTYVVDDEWGDPGELYLAFVGPAETPGGDA